MGINYRGRVQSTTTSTKVIHLPTQRGKVTTIRGNSERTTATLRPLRAEGTGQDYRDPTSSMATDIGNLQKRLISPNMVPKHTPVPLPKLKRALKHKHPAATLHHNRNLRCSEEPDMSLAVMV